METLKSRRALITISRNRSEHLKRETNRTAPLNVATRRRGGGPGSGAKVPGSL